MNCTTKKAVRTLGLGLALSLCGTAAFAGILKKPYIIYEMPNSTMTVLWQDTGVETTNTLSWYTDAAMTQLVNSATVPEETRIGTLNQHYYKIAGLQPNTRYYYKVESFPGDASNVIYGTGNFITAPDESAPAVKFIGQGDSRSNP
jgi:phosphodiesterase/alkaline phosphatase D-like protein